MVLRVRHKGLRLYWEKEDARRLNQHWTGRIDRIMSALEQAQTPVDMDLPGFRLHQLTGDYQGFYAANVSGNWGIVFRFEGRDTTDIDLIDYH